MKVLQFLFLSLFGVSCLQASYTKSLRNTMRLQSNVTSALFARNNHNNASNSGLLQRMQDLIASKSKKRCPFVSEWIAKEKAKSPRLSDYEIARASVYLLISEERRSKEIGMIDWNARSNAEDALTYSQISKEELGAIFNDIKPQVDVFDRPWRSNWSVQTGWLRDGLSKEIAREMEVYEQGHRQSSDVIIRRLLRQDMAIEEIASLMNMPERRVKELCKEYFDSKM